MQNWTLSRIRDEAGFDGQMMMALIVNIAKGTTDPGVNCFKTNSIILKIKQPILKPLSHHLITPDIAIGVPILCAHNTIM